MASKVILGDANFCKQNSPKKYIQHYNKNFCQVMKKLSYFTNFLRKIALNNNILLWICSGLWFFAFWNKFNLTTKNTPATTGVFLLKKPMDLSQCPIFDLEVGAWVSQRIGLQIRLHQTQRHGGINRSNRRIFVHNQFSFVVKLGAVGWGQTWF